MERKRGFQENIQFGLNLNPTTLNAYFAPLKNPNKNPVCKNSIIGEDDDISYWAKPSSSSSANEDWIKGKHCENEPIISGPFKVVLFLFNIFGIVPLTYSKSQGKFGINATSLRFIISLLVMCWYAFVWIAYFSIFGLKKPIYHTRLSDSTDALDKTIQKEKELGAVAVTSILWCLKMAYIILPLVQLYNLFTNWHTTSTLATFLNNWSVFDYDFNRAFPKGVAQGGKTGFRIKICDVQWSISADWLLFLYAGFPLMFIIPGPFLMDFKTLYFVDVCIAISCSLRISSLEFLEDIKSILMYRACANAFTKIKQGIKFTTEASANILNSKQVEQWRSLVIQARNQCELLNKYQTRSELAFLAYGIVLLTTSLFLLMNIPWGKSEAQFFGAMWAFLSIVTIFRLYIKLSTAEKITREEHEVGRLLTLIGSHETDFTTLVQVKFIHDLISENPSGVSFGKYISFNKGLLLSVFNQVVTYLIVLMQFTQGK